MESLRRHLDLALKAFMMNTNCPLFWSNLRQLLSGQQLITPRNRLWCWKGTGSISCLLLGRAPEHVVQG